MVNFGLLAAEIVSLVWDTELISTGFASCYCTATLHSHTFNRQRHLYLAGRPSRWALAHVSSCSIICRISPATGELVPQTSCRGFAPWTPLEDFHPRLPDEPHLPKFLIRPWVITSLYCLLHLSVATAKRDVINGCWQCTLRTVACVRSLDWWFSIRDIGYWLWRASIKGMKRVSLAVIRWISKGRRRWLIVSSWCRSSLSCLQCKCIPRLKCPSQSGVDHGWRWP